MVVVLSFAFLFLGCGEADEYATEGNDSMEYDTQSEEAKVELTFNEPMSSEKENESTGTEYAEGFNRKIIYNGQVNMEVKDFAAIQTKIRDLTHLSNAYILHFSEEETSYEVGGNYTIKVPAQGFHSFLDSLEKMEPIYMQKSLTGKDVTEEYVDLASRLSAKQVVESRLLAFMESAQETDALVEFSNELERVQGEIEVIKGRLRYLDSNVSFSTIDLRVYEMLDDQATKRTEDESLLERASDAMKDSFSFLSQLFQGIFVFIAGAIPIIILLALVAVPTWIISMRTIKTSRQQKKTNNKS